MADSKLYLRRKEKKYLILEYPFEQIKDVLQKHIPVHIYKGSDCKFGIETTYLDTSDFMLYNEYLSKRDFRFKVRLRRYKNDGLFDDNYFVELKVKANKISSKRRFILPAELLNSFLKGKDISSKIKNINLKLPEALNAYYIITQLVNMYHLIPVLRSSYLRMAFQSPDDNIRVTVDHKVVHEKLIGEYDHATLDAVILESKVIGKTPKWQKKMLNQLSPIRQNRFSKFATGINSLYFPERGKYNFYADEDIITPVPEMIISSKSLINSAFAACVDEQKAEHAGII